ncbi:MAG: prepilin peptidase [Candidatus Ancillula sp.]|nr:prepilin peptidase [Candidatus Ancillula sp.]
MAFYLSAELLTLVWLVLALEGGVLLAPRLLTASFLVILPYFALTDFLEHRVPNIALLLCLALRILLTLVQLHCESAHRLVGHTARDLGVGLAFALALCLVGKATHGGVGMGDVKFSLVMPLFLGGELSFYSLLLGFSIAALFSTTKLLLKTGAGAFALVPYIYAATLIVVYTDLLI